MRQLATSQPHSQGAGLYIRTAVQYAGCMLVLTLAVVLPTAWFGIRNFSLSDPEGGQLVRDSLEAEHAHAFKRAAEIALEGLGTATPAQPQQTIAVEALKLYYVAGRTSAEDADRSGNVLTVSNIQRIAALEDELVSLGRWPEVCLRQRGQLECAPLLSAVPYLRHATNESELRSSIDDLYQTLEGNPEPHLGPDPDPALTSGSGPGPDPDPDPDPSPKPKSRLARLAPRWVEGELVLRTREGDAVSIRIMCAAGMRLLPFSPPSALPPSHTRL